MGRVQTLLSHYFQPNNPAELQEAALMDWLEVLEGFSEDDINRSCAAYLRDQPRRRPGPGDIRAGALTFRKERMDRQRRALPPLPEEPKGPRVTPDAAARIMAEAGVDPNLSDVLKRFPMAKTPEEAYERAAAPEQRRMTCETNPERLLAARRKAGVL